MAAVEPPWKRLKSTSKAPASPTPATASRPRVNIKPVIDLVQETVEWPSEPVPEVTIDPCCKHYRDLTRSTEKVNLTLSRRGATEVVGEALVDSPAEPTKEDADCKDPDAVSTIICTLRNYRDPRSIITTNDGTSEVVAVAEEYRGTYGHLRDRKASSTVIIGDSNSEQQEASASVAESDSGRDAAMTPREKSDGDQRSVKSPSPARSPSQAPSAPWMRAAQAAAASLAWFGKGKGMPFMGPAAFARMAAMNRMRAAQAYQEQRTQQGEQTETLSSMEEAVRHQATITQPAVPMEPPRAVPQAIPGLQYQPPQPATQNLSEGFVPPQPPMAAPPFHDGGAFQSGGPPPSEPPRPPPAGIIAGQQQLPNLPPQQPPMPMPPWPPRGPSYGPSGGIAYPHVTEPSAPGYEAYHHDQRWEGSEGGASEHQAFYGYRATADDYNTRGVL
ncbi:hypothetical protein FOZ61_001924 [Perkinsus olseni]|uniref:Uncharacterized protein n=1 Tax=Perkinsus olseni TaxID=32597 RepID=A0A7J6LWE8_PEROL|nr:hypothetical protein FOZ61_001924 [Perkinsus olseni]